MTVLVLGGADASEPIRLPGRPAPHLASLILPRRAPDGAYQLSIIDGPLEAARDRLLPVLAPGARVNDPAGAWVIAREEPLEAFGGGGLYNRSRLARIFTGHPVRVLRAPIRREGKVVASLTLYSPRPSDDFSRLETDTLAVLLIVDPARRQHGVETGGRRSPRAAGTL